MKKHLQNHSNNENITTTPSPLTQVSRSRSTRRQIVHLKLSIEETFGIITEEMQARVRASDLRIADRMRRAWEKRAHLRRGMEDNQRHEANVTSAVNPPNQEILSAETAETVRPFRSDFKGVVEPGLSRMTSTLFRKDYRKKSKVQSRIAGKQP